MEEDPVISGRRLSELKVTELKAELDRRGLSKTGNKAVLQVRLKSDMEEEMNRSGDALNPGMVMAQVADHVPQVQIATNGSSPPFEGERREAPPAAQEEAAMRASAGTDTTTEEGAAKGTADDDDGQVTGVAADDGGGGDGAVESAAVNMDGDGEAERTALSPPPQRHDDDDKRSQSSDEHVSQEKRDSPPVRQASDDNAENGDDHESSDSDQGEQKRQRRDSGSSSSDEEEQPVEAELELHGADEDDIDIGGRSAAAQPITASHDAEHSEGITEQTESVEGENVTSKVTDPSTGGESDALPRKRKWGQTKAGRRPAAVTISSDSLKDLMKEANERDVELDYEEDQHQQTIKPKRIVIAEMDSTQESGEGANEEQEDTRPVRVVMEDDARVYGFEEPNQQREVKRTVDDFRRSESPTAARHPTSNVIHIRCLTRPFTQKILFELLHKFGSFHSDVDFWIDSIKSNCIVKYATIEEGKEARERLHNIHWPHDNHKPLKVDFATEEILLRHQGRPVPSSAKGKENQERSPPEKERHEHRRRRESPPGVKEPKRRRSQSPPTKHTDDGRRRTGKQADTTDRRGDGGGGRPTMVAEREWDRGKQWKRGESPPALNDRRRPPPGGRSPPPIGDPRQRFPGARFPPPVEVEKPAKLLDDLFRKTVATPCIYWMPLTEEQIRQRACAKAKAAVTDVSPPQREKQRSSPAPPPSSHRRRRSPSPPRRSRR